MADQIALVYGDGQRVAQVTTALEQRGVHVRGGETLEELVSLCGGLADGSVDLYVQLPTSVEARGSSVVARVRNFLSDGLIARFDAAGTVMPKLRRGASVVLVSGNHPADTAAPDNQRARMALLQVLGSAVIMERPDDDLSVTIVDHLREPDELAAIALEPPAARIRVLADFAEASPELDWGDWRNELLSLTTTEA